MTRECGHANGRIIVPVQKTYFIRFGIAVGMYVLATVFGPFGHADGFNALYQTAGNGAYATAASGPAMLAVVVGGTPTLVFCYLFSDYLQEGLAHAAASVFTRTAQRSAWAGRRLGQLAAFTLGYTLAGGMLSAVLLFVLNGAQAQGWTGVIELLGYATTLNTLQFLVILIPLNILALRRNVVGCFVSFMAVYFASLLICSTLPASAATGLIPWLPTTQGVFAWHDTVLTRLMSGQGIVQGFSLLQSYGYLLVFIVLETGIAIRYLKRFELL